MSIYIGCSSLSTINRSTLSPSIFAIKKERLRERNHHPLYYVCQKIILFIQIQWRTVHTLLELKAGGLVIRPSFLPINPGPSYHPHGEKPPIHALMHTLH